ncbi:MAG TPA: hypothetical protein VFI18_08390 [Gaiellales bacterium]|nr:hypothetical protein [Gaiellales bacterium]
MTVWWLLVAAPAAGLAGVRRLRARRAARERPPERVVPAVLGLPELPVGGAFVQFSNASPASRVALNRLAEAVAHHPGVTVVELPSHSPCAAMLRVRSAPTVLLVDASGAVRRRWTKPPERAELAALLGPPAQAPVAAGSR